MPTRRSPVDLLTRPGVLVTPMGLAAPVRPGGGEVSSLVYETVTPAHHLAEYLTRAVDADSARDSRDVMRRALVVLANEEVIPVIEATEDSRQLEPRRSTLSLASDGLLPFSLGRPSRARVLISDLLHRVGARNGFLVQRDGVRRISARRSARPTRLEVDGLRVRLNRTRYSLARHRALVEKAVKGCMDASGELAVLAQRLPSDHDLTSRILYQGREFCVALDERDVLAVSRKLLPWSVRHLGTVRYFPRVEIRVLVGLDVAACPWVSDLSTHPAIRHMFVRNGTICVAGYTGRSPSVGRRTLELLERGEVVLKVPSNPSGEGGFESLVRSGSHAPR
jgi:hypothetical protein